MIRSSAALALCLAAAPALADPADYASPQEALDAMIAALEARDRAAGLAVFGPEAEDLIYTGDPELDRTHREAVLDAWGEGYRFAPRPEGGVEILFGADGWPFPIPLVRGASGWHFDIAAGREEIADRQIGLNELDVIALMQAYVDLQAEYRLVDHDGDGVMEFAASIISDDGRRDGLYWDGADSPIGIGLARASADGFNDGVADHAPEPYRGYYFRILDAQGPAAPGGPMSYLVNGHMLSGHALIGFPAVYGETGVNTFLVAENGLILEADLGPDTVSVADAIDAYDPGEDWQPVN